jgi:hypothetical protein
VTLAITSGYLNCFFSYLTSRQFHARYFGILSTPFIVRSGVTQESVIGPLLFNILMKDLCDVSNHSKFITFAKDLKMYQGIISLSDRFLLQSDIDCVYK